MTSDGLGAFNFWKIRLKKYTYAAGKYFEHFNIVFKNLKRAL